MFKIIFIVSLLYLNANAQSANLLDTTYVSWANTGLKTNFYVTSTLNPAINPNDAWIAVGLNNQNLMSDANVIVCRFGPNEKSVKSYVNTGYLTPNLIDSFDPQVGLSNVKIELSEKNLTCQFTRENILLVSKYFPLNPENPTYLLVAYGAGDLSYHGSNKAVTDKPIIAQVTNEPLSTPSTTKIINTTTTIKKADDNLLKIVNIILSQIFSFFKSILPF